MRTAFRDTLCDLAAQDPRLFLVCGDLGYNVLDKFSQAYPDRFLNAGIAEQNMTGLAAGLAHSGYNVFIYSIVNFPVMRCLEQVRNDVCYHNLPVKIVTVGGGLVYGGHGYTHHGSEDLAVMRVLPNMTVLAPGDPVESRLATRAAHALPGPCYLRLGRGGETDVHLYPPDFVVGKAITLRDGTDLSILTTGGTLPLAHEAASILAAQGLSIGVHSFPSLAPFDDQKVLQLASSTRRILTLEEHGLGGLASLVAETLAFASSGVQFRAIRLSREPLVNSGTHEFLRSQHGMSVGNVVNVVEQMCRA